jgi:hypothetical protein
LLYIAREFAHLGTEVFLHFSKTRNFPEISMVFGQGSPLPLLVLYIPGCRKTFSEFSGDFPLQEMKEYAPGGI